MQCAIFAPILLFCNRVGAQVTTNTLITNADSHVYSGSTASNYGTSATSELWVQSSTNHYRYFLSFDLASLSIPSNAVVTSATVSLTPTGVGEGGAGSSSFILRAVTSSWTETGVTYASSPTNTSTNQVTSSSLVSSKRTFNVTTLVQNSVNGSLSLYGFRIHRNPETTVVSQCQYHTDEAALSTDKPTLSVSWYVPFSITSATITNATTLTGTNGSITPVIAGGSGSPTYQWIDSTGATVGTSLALSSKPYGWYGFKVTGTLGDTYYMAFIIGVNCEMVRVRFRQDPNFIDDSYTRNFIGSTGTNFGTATTMRAGAVSGTGDYYLFLRYRLWFNSAQSFYKATQTLYGNAHVSSSNNACNLYRTSADWNESTIAYSNQPGVNTTTPALIVLPATLSSTENTVTNLTSHFQYWMNNPTSNFGYRLNGASANAGYLDYHSSDAATSTNRPTVTLWMNDATCDRTAYYSFKRELDASMVNTVSGKLKVQFTEEYEQEPGKKWPIKLYDYNRSIKGGINYDGSAVSGSPALLPAVPYVFGDNRSELNLTSYGLVDGNYYILELTKSTGEKEYIEFIYKN